MNSMKKVQLVLWPSFLGLIAMLTSCAPAQDQTAPSVPPPTSASTLSPPTATMAPIMEATVTITESELNLEEANVVDVQFNDQGGRMFRFDVTLYHDDDGEAPSYADWWQVEDESGNELGKRILLHGHSTAPFTRSETIRIPEGLTIVVVRGHDMTHGHGGQSIRVDLETGTLSPFNEG